MPEEKHDVLHGELIPILMIEEEERAEHTKIIAKAAGAKIF